MRATVRKSRGHAGVGHLSEGALVKG